MATIAEALAAALDHHLAGRAHEAEILYGRIRAADPENADALHLSGVLAAQLGRPAEATQRIARAIASRPDVADYHVNLAKALSAAGRAAAAAGPWARAAALDPARGEAWLALALVLAAAGRPADAVAALGAVLDRAPQHTEARLHRAVLLEQLGRRGEAAADVRVLLRAAPGDADLHLSLGRLLDARADAAQRAAHLRAALALDPAHGDAVGEWVVTSGDAAWLRRAVTVRPDAAAARINLALAERRAGRDAAVLAHLRAAAALQPDAGATLYANLAAAAYRRRQAEATAVPARRAVRLDPGAAAGWVNLGLALELLDRVGPAAAAMERALALEPDAAATWSNHASVLRRNGRIVEAVDAAGRALTVDPSDVGALMNRAVAWQDRGRIAEAVADGRRALALAPQRADIHSNLLLALQYAADGDAPRLLAEHRAWDARHGATPAAPRAFANPRDPERRLRIGYVSADFAHHPIGYFLAPVLPAHDRTAVEVFCYSNRSGGGDGMTARLRAASDHWRPIHDLDDAAAAALIAADGIDVLVDLAGHTGGNRLPLFARRAAPVQATWAGYVGTTGLQAMDWLIADARHMPPGSEGEAVERVYRMPDTYVCVLPRPDAPAVGPLPLRANGHATFGCFNNRAKLSEGTLALWARLLARVPGARLLLKTHQFDDPAVCAETRAAFARSGGDTGRLDLSGRASHGDLPGWYNRIDVALDPFPYSGGLTTLEALWMGVPVVTPGGGDRFCARHSTGHLTVAGLPELVAADAAAYLAIAAGLVADPDRLADLRAGLRGRMAASPLCDGPRFARALETAFRTMWRHRVGWRDRVGSRPG